MQYFTKIYDICYLFLELFHYFKGRVISILLPLKYKGSKTNSQPPLFGSGGDGSWQPAFWE